MKQDDRSGGLNAEITVFISLIMMCLFALFCVLVESARTAGARWYLQMAANSALDSVFSQYHRQLWDTYRLLFVEYESEEEVLADFIDFVQPYLETENWYPLKYESGEVEGMLTALDESGAYLEKNILDYMEYGFWNLDFDVDMADELLSCGKEAEAVTRVAENYRGHAADALRLEKSLEAISGNLADQMEKKQEGLSHLRSYDNDGFQRKAKELIRLFRKVPNLVETYRKRADTLAEALEASRKDCVEDRKECSDAVDQILEDEICQYEAYVSLDGARRKEIELLEQLSEEQILQVQEVMEAADEVESIIEEWEDEEDEEDVLEEGTFNDGQPRGNVTSDTTAKKVIRLVDRSTRVLIETERRLRYIENAIKKLTPEEKKIFEYIFKDGYNQVLAQMYKYISKDSYYNTYNKAVYYTALEFGYI